MPNTIIPYSQYEFKSNRTYFFDNNIWIAIYVPSINSNEDKHRKSLSFFQKAQHHNSQIALVSLIVSELTNTVIRLRYNYGKSVLRTIWLIISEIISKALNSKDILQK